MRIEEAGGKWKAHVTVVNVEAKLLAVARDEALAGAGVLKRAALHARGDSALTPRVAQLRDFRTFAAALLGNRTVSASEEDAVRGELDAIVDRLDLGTAGRKGAYPNHFDEHNRTCLSLTEQRLDHFQQRTFPEVQETIDQFLRPDFRGPGQPMSDDTFLQAVFGAGGVISRVRRCFPSILGPEGTAVHTNLLDVARALRDRIAEHGTLPKRGNVEVMVAACRAVDVHRRGPAPSGAARHAWDYNAVASSASAWLRTASTWTVDQYGQVLDLVAGYRARRDLGEEKGVDLLTYGAPAIETARSYAAENTSWLLVELGRVPRGVAQELHVRSHRIRESILRDW